MPQDEGRNILLHAAQYQNRLWTEEQDFDAYRAYMYLLWMIAPEEGHLDTSIV